MTHCVFLAVSRRSSYRTPVTKTPAGWFLLVGKSEPQQDLPFPALTIAKSKAGLNDGFAARVVYRSDMEIYFSFWTFAMFTFNVSVTVFGFGMIHREMRQMREEMKQQVAHQDEIWQRLFAKADNTERISQEILMRLANGGVPH